MNNPLGDMTPAQIEAMRSLVLEHDKKHSSNSFDPSAPQIVPYKFQEFPKTLYKHEQCLPSRAQVKKTQLGGEELHFLPPVFKTVMARDVDHAAQLVAEGWSEEAPTFSEQEEAEPVVRASRKKVS